MGNKTHWKKAFNSDYLSSADIETKDLILTIKHVKLTEITGQQGKQLRNVATFYEKVKPMILNVTNSKQVRKFAGSRYIEDWKDIPVQIYVDTKVRMMGEETEGLRIRPTQPKLNKDELMPGTDKWESAKEFLKQPNNDISSITKHYKLSDENYDKLLAEIN